MNLRVIATIIALSAPVAILFLITQYAGESPASKQTATSVASGSPRPPLRPPTNLEEAKEQVRRHLAILEKMTEAQWQAEQKRRREDPRRARRPAWDDLPLEQKIQTLERNQQQLNANEGRAPDITPAPAAPLMDNFPKTPPAN